MRFYVAIIIGALAVIALAVSLASKPMEAPLLVEMIPAQAEKARPIVCIPILYRDQKKVSRT